MKLDQNAAIIDLENDEFEIENCALKCFSHVHNTEVDKDFLEFLSSDFNSPAEFNNEYKNKNCEITENDKKLEVIFSDNVCHSLKNTTKPIADEIKDAKKSSKQEDMRLGNLNLIDTMKVANMIDAEFSIFRIENHLPDNPLPICKTNCKSNPSQNVCDVDNRSPNSSENSTPALLSKCERKSKHKHKSSLVTTVNKLFKNVKKILNPSKIKMFRKHVANSKIISDLHADSCESDTIL